MDKRVGEREVLSLKAPLLSVMIEKTRGEKVITIEYKITIKTQDMVLVNYLTSNLTMATKSSQKRLLSKLDWLRSIKRQLEKL